MELLLVLFPSSEGELASESQEESNFGSKVTIEVVATMLKFTKKVRDLKKLPKTPKTIRKMPQEINKAIKEHNINGPFSKNTKKYINA